MRHSSGALPRRFLTVPSFGQVKETSVFIVWGKKVVYRKLGHVAGHERSCHECGTAQRAETTAYATISKKPLSLPELIRTSHPRLEDADGERLALEAPIQGDPASLSQENRHVLIRNSFLMMSAKMEQRLVQAHIDTGMSLALVGALATLVFGPHLVLSMFPDMEAVRLFIFLAILAVTGVVWQVMASRTRFVRRAVLPALAAALRPLAPTPAELESVVTQLTHLKYQMAKRIKVPELQARLAAAIPA
jgi:hypothetical protein